MLQSLHTQCEKVLAAGWRVSADPWLQRSLPPSSLFFFFFSILILSPPFSLCSFRPYKRLHSAENRFHVFLIAASPVFSLYCFCPDEKRLFFFFLHFITTVVGFKSFCFSRAQCRALVPRKVRNSKCRLVKVICSQQKKEADGFGCWFKKGRKKKGIFVRSDVFFYLLWRTCPWGFFTLHSHGTNTVVSAITLIFYFFYFFLSWSSPPTSVCISVTALSGNSFCLTYVLYLTVTSFLLKRKVEQLKKLYWSR